jgi:hypothetical protein
VQVVRLNEQDGSSSVQLFQASNGGPVMRFSNATHVCMLNNVSSTVEDDDSAPECAFAVVRLVDDDNQSSANRDNETDDMFTDIPMEANASFRSLVTITALLVMHDLAVPATLAAAPAAIPIPSPALPIPKILPPASYTYVFSHNARLRQGRQASSRLIPNPIFTVY